MAKLSPEAQIEEVLTKIRPLLEMHKGGVEFVAFNASDGIVEVRLIGMCANCPLSDMTLKMGIEELLKDTLPIVKKVIAVS